MAKIYENREHFEIDNIYKMFKDLEDLGFPINLKKLENKKFTEFYDLC